MDTTCCICQEEAFRPSFLSCVEEGKSLDWEIFFPILDLFCYRKRWGDTIEEMLYDPIGLSKFVIRITVKGWIENIVL